MTDGLIETLFDLDTLSENPQQQAVRPETIKDGTHHFKIMPPYGTKNGRALHHEYWLHWGFTGQSGKPTPVACSYQTEGYCPECKEVFALLDQRQAAEAAKDKDKLKQLRDVIGRRQRKKTFVYNVALPGDGLKVISGPTTFHELLGKKIAEAVRLGIDPCSPAGGCWFEVTRKGTGYDTEYGVEFKYIERGGGVREIDRTPLSDDLCRKILDQLKTGQKGPLKDIHAIHEVRTSADIAAFMRGIPVGKMPQGASAAIANALADDVPDVGAPLAPAPQPKMDFKAEMDRIQALKQSSVS